MSNLFEYEKKIKKSVIQWSDSMYIK